MPLDGEQMVHFSLLLIAQDGQPGPTLGNYNTLQEAVDNWVENYTEDGPDIAIVRVFSEWDSKAKMYEVKSMEVVSEEEVESVQIDDSPALSDATFGGIVNEMNDEDDFIADEHSDWDIKEFYAIVNYTAALDDESIGMEVPPISSHDSLEEAKAEHASKKYSNDYSIVIRQLKVNPADPREYYLFDEWDAE